MFLGSTFEIGALVLVLTCLAAICAARFSSRPEPVSLTITFARPPDAVRAWAITSLYKLLRSSGYEIAVQSEGQIALRHTYRAPSTWFFAVVFLPVGFVLLLAFRRTSQITLLIRPVGDGFTELLVSGELPRGVARELAKIAVDQATQPTALT
jgi:hypothetical protein